MLDHPNISRVIDYLPDEGALVVQFIDGQDGTQILRESGPMDGRMLMDTARAVTEAIAYAHDKKIAHRDIKPANILVDKNGHVFLIDFGIAKEVGGDQTKTGYQALTPMFAAPERQTGESSYNPFLSDIYEMGVTLFNFATNTMPYRNPVAPSLEEWGGIHSKRLSPQFRYILKKATHPDPAQRYQSAAEMVEEIRELKEVYISDKKKSTTLIAGAAIVVAVAAAVYFGGDFIGGMFGGGDATDQAVPAGPVEQMTETTTQPDSQQFVDVGDEVVTDDGGAQVDEPPTEVVTRQEAVTTETATQETEDMPLPVVYDAPTPRLTIRVQPSDINEMYVDGIKRSLGRSFDAKEGSHTVEITHPDYPIMRKTLVMRADPLDITYELNREFRARDLLGIQLALLPPSEQSLLEVSLNGKAHRYTQFPVMDLQCLSGDWNFAVTMVPINVDEGAEPKIDSCVTFPYGGGPRNKLKGSGGVLTLSGGENGNIVPLLIYWSQ
jgi:hypothetical protein